VESFALVDLSIFKVMGVRLFGPFMRQQPALTPKSGRLATKNNAMGLAICK